MSSAQHTAGSGGQQNIAEGLKRCVCVCVVCVGVGLGGGRTLRGSPSVLLAGHCVQRGVGGGAQGQRGGGCQ